MPSGEQADEGGRRQGPLDGVRVIELAGIGPCPMCAMLLAELGAEVIRIDRIPSDPGGKPIGSGDYLNRSRRSAAVDLKDPRGAELVLRLACGADALIEGLRPGVTERLGVGPRDCARVNARLVYGRVTGWGQEGPLSRAAGHDLNYIALTGALHAIGRAGGPPTPPLNLVGDYGGGALYLAMGVIAALFEARRSGKGQVVDAAMLDGAASLMTAAYALKETAIGNRPRGSNLLDGGSHLYDVYRTRDGRYVALAPLEEKFYQELLQRAGADPADVPHSMDPIRWPELKARVGAVMETRTRDEWVALLEGTDACFAPVLDMDEAPLHPHNLARETFVRTNGAWQPNAAPRFSRTPAGISGPPARPGQHTREALREWGLEPGEIDRLIDAGVVVQTEAG